MAKQSSLARLEALELRIEQAKPVYFEIIRPGASTVTLKAPPGYRHAGNITITRSYGTK